MRPRRPYHRPFFAWAWERAWVVQLSHLFPEGGATSPLSFSSNHAQNNIAPPTFELSRPTTPPSASPEHRQIPSSLVGFAVAAGRCLHYRLQQTWRRYRHHQRLEGRGQTPTLGDEMPCGRRRRRPTNAFVHGAPERQVEQTLLLLWWWYHYY